jgi:hypothetical protein
VQVTDEELMEWFRYIDHVVPHKRVALSELSCEEDGKEQKHKCRMLACPDCLVCVSSSYCEPASSAPQLYARGHDHAS